MRRDCVFIPSPVREGSTLFGDHSAVDQLFLIELKPVKKFRADANLKRIQYKILVAPENT